MKHWYAVQSRAHEENRAESNLARQGFETWLPRYWKKRRHAGRAESVLRPLFPRYLFVSLDLDAERWRKILSTYGVMNLVGTSDGPTLIPDGIIEALKARADDDGAFTLAHARRLRKGDAVHITGGAMEALSGVFEEIDDRQRVVVLLQLLGREVRVSVPPDDVEAKK